MDNSHAPASDEKVGSSSDSFPVNGFRIPVPVDNDNPDIQDLSEVLESLKIGTKEEVMEKRMGLVKNKRFYLRIHPSILEKYKEFFWNWVPDDVIDTPEEAENLMFQVLPQQIIINKKILSLASMRVRRYADYSHELAEEKDLEFCTFESMSYKVINAFSNLMLGQYSEAKEDLTDASLKLSLIVERGYISEDHSTGLLYLIEGLLALNHNLTSINPSTKSGSGLSVEKEKCLVEFLESSQCFETLPDKGKVAVNGVRVYFIRSFSLRCNRDLAAYFKELLESDPDTIEWHILHHYVMRLGRKEGDRFELPSQEEKDCVEKLLKMNRDHVFVKSALCKHLCDTLKRESNRRSREEVFQILDYRFNDNRAIVDFVKEKSMEMLETMPYSTKTNLSVAEFFSKSVPASYRDPELAKKCILRALEVSPGCSKTNHWMGLHLLVYERKFDEALEYVSKAWFEREDNFPALMDVLQLKMRNLDENYDELLDLFNVYLSEEGFNKSVYRANLYFLLGVLYFLKGNTDMCINAWLDAFELNKGVLSNLGDLHHHIHRYGWKASRCEIENIQLLLMRKKQEFMLSHRDQELLCIESALAHLQGRSRRRAEDSYRYWFDNLHHEDTDPSDFRFPESCESWWRRDGRAQWHHGSDTVRSRESRATSSTRSLSECDLDSDWRSVRGRGRDDEVGHSRPPSPENWRVPNSFH